MSDRTEVPEQDWILQKLKSLRPIDDDFLRCLLKDNIPLAELILRLLTGISDLQVTRLKTQADMKRLAGSRSICLDAYATDSSGRKYDLEIQRSDSGANVHRARYHSSVLDIENLKSSQPFSALPDTYTIFITEHDIFHGNQAIYPLESVNLATGQLVNDGRHILYVNASYWGNDPIGRLMHDFFCSNPDEMYTKELADTCRYYKENEKGVSYMSKIMEDMYKDFGEMLREKLTREVTEEVTREVTREVTAEVTEKVTNEVTREVSVRTYIDTCREFGILSKEILLRKLLQKFSFLTEDQALTYLSR